MISFEYERELGSVSDGRTDLDHKSDEDLTSDEPAMRQLIESECSSTGRQARTTRAPR